MGFGLFGKIAGAPFLSEAGKEIFIQNSGLIWNPLILISAVGVWFGMNNVRQYSPGLKSDLGGIFNSLYLIFFGLAGSFLGVYLLVGLKLNTFLVLIISVVVTLLLIKLLSPGSLKEKLNKQFEILGDKHNWVMTIIYVMTFGSFIGYAASFPKLIQDVFGYLPDGSKNPLAPSPMAWAWLGPFLGAVIRPIGGWISDKVGSGSKITAWSTYIQIVGALGVAYFIIQARQAPQPEAYWMPFFLMFMLLFIGSGIGNGSTFRSIPYIFPKEKAGAVLGWSGAIGAYGSFIIPKMFVVCLFLNWYFYDRKNSEVKC
jgi:NNP family nitrate/nitrite transporter-like MFS transporter